VSECGNYLIITPQKDCRDNLLYFADIGSLKDGPQGPLTLHQIVDRFEADYEVPIQKIKLFLNAIILFLVHYKCWARMHLQDQ